MSLDVLAAVLADPSLEGWDGFGLAIQAYQKRALAVIEHVEALARALGRRMMVRLVKGAYWDTEVKRAQERGLDDYPVFTRKAVTDLNYVHCARRLLAARPHLYPQFATHNALTIATIVEAAGGVEGYEFQRLHGMGEETYKALMRELPATACRIYAPVGGHADLLAYLVRRLLENGANSNFVSVSADPAVPVTELLKRPAALVGSPARARHRRIPLPKDIYGAVRQNSRGVELGSRVRPRRRCSARSRRRGARQLAGARPRRDAGRRPRGGDRGRAPGRLPRPGTARRSSVARRGARQGGRSDGGAPRRR